MSEEHFPEWMRKQETTRGRSKKQEKKVAKDLATFNGRTTINSGATFSENDVTSTVVSVECKTTYKQQYTLKMAEWDKLVGRTKDTLIPIEVVEFAAHGKTLAIIAYEELLELLKNQPLKTPIRQAFPSSKKVKKDH